MGRGKSKAKQTKVARELKYGSAESDLGALEKELRDRAETDSDFQHKAKNQNDISDS